MAEPTRFPRRALTVAGAIGALLVVTEVGLRLAGAGPLPGPAPLEERVLAAQQVTAPRPALLLGSPVRAASLVSFPGRLEDLSQPSTNLLHALKNLGDFGPRLRPWVVILGADVDLEALDAERRIRRREAGLRDLPVQTLGRSPAGALGWLGRRLALVAWTQRDAASRRAAHVRTLSQVSEENSLSGAERREAEKRLEAHLEADLPPSWDPRPAAEAAEPEGERRRRELSDESARAAAAEIEAVWRRFHARCQALGAWCVYAVEPVEPLPMVRSELLVHLNAFAEREGLLLVQPSLGMEAELARLGVSPDKRPPAPPAAPAQPPAADPGETTRDLSDRVNALQDLREEMRAVLEALPAKQAAATKMQGELNALGERLDPEKVREVLRAAAEEVKARPPEAGSLMARARSIDSQLGPLMEPAPPVAGDSEEIRQVKRELLRQQQATAAMAKGTVAAFRALRLLEQLEIALPRLRELTP
jgi:hypothetical protein